MPVCSEPVPLYDFGAGHTARCYLYDEKVADKTLAVESAPQIPGTATSAAVEAKAP
jgi:hypothetical protein